MSSRNKGRQMNFKVKLKSYVVILFVLKDEVNVLLIVFCYIKKKKNIRNTVLVSW